MKALQDVYPQFSWTPWAFDWTPRGFWADPKNLKIFFDWLAADMGIETTEQWYKVKYTDISAAGGAELLKYWGDSYVLALQQAYPGTYLSQ